MKKVMNSEKLIIRRSLIAFSILLVSIFATSLATAQETICSGVEAQRTTYLPISGRLYTNALDSRTDPGDSAHEVVLRGTLHYRRPIIGDMTLKNRPTLIFNHGHEQKRGEACAIVEYFTANGWVVFTPLRRGHFIDLPGDAVYRSTGIYIDEFVDKCSRSQSEAESGFPESDDPPYLPHLYRGSGFCRPGAPITDPAVRRSAVELSYLAEQRIDVRDAITYLKSLPAITSGVLSHTWKLVDPKNIVVLGHSYGGALTILTNQFDYGQSVAIDIAGAELSWDNPDEPYWKIDLMEAMQDQKRPMFLFQARNGKYLTPTKNLFKIGVNQEYRIQAAIYGNAPACADNDSDGLCDGDPTQTVFKDIHGNFIGVPAQVASWGPAVIDFAKRNQR
jgi:hypothetical protein